VIEAAVGVTEVVSVVVPGEGAAAASPVSGASKSLGLGCHKVEHKLKRRSQRGGSVKKVLAILASMFLMSMAMLAQQVSVNYNHNQSFSQYHTYAWGSQNQNQIQNSILAQVAQQDINSAMQAKGFQMVQENQNPDLILTANGGLRQQTSYSAWGMRGIGGGMGGITPEQNVEGTMIVDLYDAKTQSLIWRGIGQNTLNNNGNKNQQMVEKAVQKMFKQWPK
jgi:hypothetical protein